MINFFPNFLGCKYKMFTSMREWFSFQVCLQAYFFLSLALSLSFFVKSFSHPQFPLPTPSETTRSVRNPFTARVFDGVL